MLFICLSNYGRTYHIFLQLEIIVIFKVIKTILTIMYFKYFDKKQSMCQINKYVVCMICIVSKVLDLKLKLLL